MVRWLTRHVSGQLLVESQGDMVSRLLTRGLEADPDSLPFILQVVDKCQVKWISGGSVDLDYKFVRAIVERECGSKVPCKVVSKLDQMVAEKWTLEGLCSFWVGHLCSDGHNAEILRVKLMQAKPEGLRDPSKTVTEQVCEDV